MSIRSRVIRFAVTALVVMGVLLVASTPRVALAAPTPTATIDPASIEVFPGEGFTFDVSFENTAAPGSGEFGYRPAFEVVLPPSVTGSAAVSETFGPLTPVQLTTVPDSGSVTNVVTGEVISGLTPGSTYGLFVLPTSSYSPVQFADVITVDATLAADVFPDGQPLPTPITATGLFLLGATPVADPETDPPIRQATPATAEVVPVLYIPDKEAVTRFGEDETATGPNYPVTYRLLADIATGASVNELFFSEEIPDNLQFTGVTGITLASPGDPDIAVTFIPEVGDPIVLYGGPLSGAVFPINGPSTPATNDPGGFLGVSLSVASGTSGDEDVVVTFDAFVPQFGLDDTTPIIDPVTGGDVPVTNILTTFAAQGQGAFGTIDLAGQEETTEPVTIEARNFAIQKDVTIISDNNVEGLSPGDVVEFALHTQISDYFQHDQIAIQDVLGDGYDYVADSGQLTQLTENGAGAGTPVAYTDQAQDPALDVSGGSYPAPLPTGTVLVTQNAQPGGATGSSAGFTTLLFDVSGLSVDGAPIELLTGGAFNGDASGANGYVTGVDDETILSVTFDVAIQDDYENPLSFPGGDPSIDSFDTLQNDTVLSGRIRDAAGGGDFDTQTSSETQTLSEPTLEKSIVALNGGDPGAEPVSVVPGDTLTFELRLDIPTGRLEELTMADYLPMPILDATEVDTTFDGTCAGFPAAGEACYAAATTDPPLSTAPAITTSAAENSITFDWPDQTTFEPTPPQLATVAIQFTVTVTADIITISDAFLLDQQQMANVVIVESGNSTLVDTFTDTNNAQFILREPVMEIDKTVDPTTADAGDTLTYTITVSNSGGADAYDVAVLDETLLTLPLTGCAVTSVTDEEGTALATTGDLFTGPTGLVITDVIPAGGQATISVDCVATTDVEPGTAYVNTSEIPQYFNEDDSDGDRTNFVDPDNPPSDDAQFTVPDPGMNKTITATSEDFTEDNNVAIGEIVSYDVVITVPEGTSPDVVFRDTLDHGLAYVDGSFSAVSSNTTDMPIIPGTPTFSNPSSDEDRVDGRLVVDFGTVTNSNTDDGVDETITISYQAVVLNNSTNNLDPATAINNDAEWYWDGGSPDGGCTPESEACFQAAAPNVTIQEAQFSVDKSANVDAADAGDTVAYTIVFTNTGNTTAYELAMADVVPDGLTYVPGSFVNTAGEAPASTDDSAPDTTGLAATWDSFPAGGSSTFTFDATVDPDPVVGAEAINTATIRWSSLPGDVPSIVTPNGNTFACERTDPDDATTCAGGDATDDYIASGSDEGVVLAPTAIGKELTETSETLEGDSDPGDANTGANPPVQIGEILTYRIGFDFPEALTPGASLADVLEAPAADGSLVLIDATLERNSTGLTMTADPGGINAAAPNTPVPVTLTDGANEFTLDLGDVSNADVDADTELLVLTVRYQVANIATNSAGTTLTDHGELRFGTGSVVETNDVSVHIAEPVVQVEKVANPSSITGGSVVTFTVTITNNAPAGGANSATGFDWTASDPLPAEYTSPTVTNIDDQGTGAVIDASFTGNTLNATIDELNPGESVVIEYEATVDPAIAFGQELTNTVTVESTSLRADDDPNERTGAGGVNDLQDTSSATTVAGLLNVSKAITPLNNPYAIGEVATFEIRVGAPVGTAENAIVTDVLDSGLTYDPGSLSVVMPGGSTSSNAPLDDSNSAFFTYDTGTNTLTFNFGTATIDTPGDIVITYGAFVTNVESNQSGTTLANSVSASRDDPNNPGETISVGPVLPEDSVIVGEPNIEMSKAITEGATGSTAGDTVGWEVTLTNAGDTTAYQLAWTDIMPDGPNGPPENDGLYNISNTAIAISGGSVFLNDTTTVPTAGDLTVSTTTNPDDTISIATIQIEPGATITITFDTVVGDAVQPNQVLVNDTAVDYASLPVDNDRERDGGDGGDDDDPTPLNNYNESTSGQLTIGADIAIDKTVDPTIYTIGDQVTYDVVVSVIQGTTAALVVSDTLPDGLIYQSHSIAFGCFGSPNTGMTPGNPAFNDRLGSDQLVQFDFGDLANPDDGDDSNDCLTISITAQVANVIENQNGDVLGNNASLTYNDAGGAAQTIDFDADLVEPGIQPLDITLTEPELEITKTVDPTEQALGDLVTFTVRVEHLPTSTADAYDVQIIDTLPVGLTYEPDSAVLPNGGTVTPSGQDLTFEFASITLAEGFIEFTYQARVDITAVVDAPLTNNARLTWTNQPGATGAPDSGRTGADGPGDGLNNYADQSEATVTPTAATTILIDKTVVDITDDPNVTLSGDILEYTIVVTNPNGPLTGVVVTDPIPVGTTYVADSLTVVSGNGTPDDSGGPLVVDIGEMANGDVTTFTFQVQVDDFTPAGTIIDNTATVDSDQTVPASDNALTPIGGDGEAQLRPEKRVALSNDVVEPTDGTINVGDQVTYTITITNEGPTDLSNLTFSDSMPAGVDVVSATGTDWDCTVTPDVNDGIDCTYLPGTLPVGAVTTITIVADVTQVSTGEPTGTWVNQGTATTDETGGVPTDGNDDPSDGAQPTEFPALDVDETGTPALDVWKSVAIVQENNGDGLLNPGESIRYTITVENTGTAPVTNATLTDDIPPDTTLIAPGVTTDTGVVVNPATQPPPDIPAPLTIDVNIGTIPVGGFATITIDLLVEPDHPTPDIVSNQAFVDFDLNPDGPVPSDDPSTDDPDDPTDLPIDVPFIVDPPDSLKTVDASGYPTLTWEMVWFNPSNDTALNTRVTDPIPADTTYIDGSVVCEAVGASTTTLCEYDAANNQIVWEGSIAPDPGATGEDDAANEVIITFQTTVVPDVLSVENQGCAFWDSDGDGFIGGPGGDPDELDQIPVCSDDPATDDPDDPTLWRAPDLAVDKSHSAEYFIVGQQGTFELAVSNVGEGPSVNTITVTDTLPAGLEYVSAEGDGWTCGYDDATREITCTTDAIVGPGESLPTITVVVNVTPEAVPEVINPVMVDTPADLNPDNDNDEDPITVVGPDLTIEKTHSAPFIIDEQAAFEIVVSNIGEGPSVNTITVTDTLPVGLEYVSATGDGWTCSYDDGTRVITCTTDAVVDQGESLPSIELVVDVLPEAFPGVINPATVEGEGDLDPDNNNDIDVVVLDAPDMTVEKSHSGAFMIGYEGTFEVTVTNVGANTSIGTITVTDTLPAGLEYVSATGDGWTCDYDDSTRTITCTTDEVIAVGESLPTITVVVDVTPEAFPLVINPVTVDADGDRNADNDEDGDIVRIVGPDLTIQKTHAAPFIIDEQSTFEIVVSNIGEGPSFGTITVTDTLPEGLEYVSATGDGWTCDYDDATRVITCTTDAVIGVGESLPTIEVVVDVLPEAFPGIVNPVTVDGEGDIDPDNNDDIDIVVLDAPDMAIEKSHSGAFMIGYEGTFEVTVTNVGANTSIGTITVTDTLPEGLEYVSAEGDSWTCGYDDGAREITCTTDEIIAIGESLPTITVVVNVTPDAFPLVINPATVDADGDRNADNDEDRDIVRVVGPDLTVDKTHRGQFLIGGQSAFEIVVSNVGEGPSFGTITVTDRLPAGLEYVSATGDGWTCGYDDATRAVTCTTDAIVGPGESLPTIEIVVDVTDEAFPLVINPVTVDGDGDLNPANNNDIDIVIFDAPDLTVDKSHSGAFVVGEQGTFEVTVTNVGANASVGTITVTDTLPVGLEYVSAEGDGWICGYDEGTRTITCTTDAVIGPGESLPPISIVVDVTEEAFPSVTNPVTVDGDGDRNPDNDDDTDTISFVGPDLSIEKSHTGEFEIGAEGTFQLVVTNVGQEPTFAPITVTDEIPAGLDFVSASGEGWTCDFDSGTRVVTCVTDAVLEPGDSLPPISITVIPTEDAPSTIRNDAVVDTDGDENDDNDEDDDVIVIDDGIDLAIDKTHEGDFTPNSQNSFILSVTNVGTLPTVEPTVVTDEVPEPLEIVSASGEGWECEVEGQVVTCTYAAPIEPGQTVSFEIIVLVPDDVTGEIANRAIVVNPDDDNPDNDEDTDTVVPDDGDADWDGDTDPGPLCTEECSSGTIYFPWVANDDDFGLGPADTSITIQNLEGADAYIFVYRGVGASAQPNDNAWELVTVTFLSRYASKTFTAEELGLEPGSGAPFAVAAYNKVYTEAGGCMTVEGGPVEPGNDVNGNERCTDVEVPFQVQLPSEEVVSACLVDDAAGQPAPFFGSDGNLYDEVGDLPGGVYPAGLNNDGDCADRETESEAQMVIDQVGIGGVAKQAVDGEVLPYTTEEDDVVAGYNAVTCHEVNWFDQWYLPIVQRNVGPGGAWNTIIRVAAYGSNVAPSAVELRFFPADDGSGSLQTGFQIQEMVKAGDTVSINLADYVPEGWVGSVHIYSDGAIFAMADRYKTEEYKVWLTTTGSNAGYEDAYNQAEGLTQVQPYVLFAPDVRFDYFGWNTGINIANLADQDNNVTVQYFDTFGNAVGTLTARLGPQGMTYFYDPSLPGQNNSDQNPEEDVNAEIVGSALIWSDHPVAVAVDATKYPETDPNATVGRIQGTTYNATANLYTWQAVPLTQKGNPNTGMGATSGINIMNPNNSAAQITVEWYNQSGAPATNSGPSVIAIPAYANGFVYTMSEHNMPEGFYGSAVVTSTLPVVATSAQVDYQVGYDGAVIWNAYNPRGFYRAAGTGCVDAGPVLTSQSGSVVLAETVQCGNSASVTDSGAPIGVGVPVSNEVHSDGAVSEGGASNCRAGHVALSGSPVFDRAGASLDHQAAVSIWRRTRVY